MCVWPIHNSSPVLAVSTNSPCYFPQPRTTAPTILKALLCTNTFCIRNEQLIISPSTGQIGEQVQLITMSSRGQPPCIHKEDTTPEVCVCVCNVIPTCMHQLTEQTDDLQFKVQDKERGSESINERMWDLNIHDYVTTGEIL